MRVLVFGLFCLLSCSALQLDRRRPRPFTAREDNRSGVSARAAENTCKATPLDFVFVIDSSRSIRPNDYEKVKTFIINLLQFLEVSPEATRVGLLQYGSEIKPEFSLSTYTTKAGVEQAVRNMEHLATGTMTGLAIRYTMETAFTEEHGARPLNLLIPRIAMIVTDGRPQDEVEEVAAQARQASIQIFAIGVGRVDMKTLKSIGSEPHSEHVHLVANFSQMETLISVFQSKLCGGADLCEGGQHQCQHICVSSPASYRCQCRKGFSLNTDGKTCKAEDACAEVDHGCQHICANVPDGYECRCRLGYQLTVDNKTCNRIDHCDLGIHGCEHDCVSVPGSYICRCMKSYILNADGKTCSKADPCADGTHGCEQEFVSSRDSCVCKCRHGYTLNPDGKTCKSLSLCETADHGCEHLCVNTGDSYVCQCWENFKLGEDGKSCTQSECTDGAMDLVFVIDGSKSLGPSNFERVKQFVNTIVDSLAVSMSGTRVGLIQYSTKVRTEFTLDQHSSASAIKRAVTRMQYMGRGSMTGSALRRMFELSSSAEEGARANASRVSIVFTDGRSQDDVSEWASRAKASGVTIYALGVGKAIEQELREIASEPDEKHLYYAEDFEKIGEVTQKLKSRFCQEKSSSSSSSSSSDDLCECENVIQFQTQTSEKLKNLLQSVDVLTQRLQNLENQLVRN